MRMMVSESVIAPSGSYAALSALGLEPAAMTMRGAVKRVPLALTMVCWSAKPKLSLNTVTFGDF
jgi:hypothetical protein